MKNAADFEPGYEDAPHLFHDHGQPEPAANDPSMKQFLDKLENNDETTVGDLVAFMDAYNLRFGPATIGSTDRDLYPARPDPDGDPRSGQNRRVLARLPPTGPVRFEGSRQGGFKPMKWDQPQGACAQPVTQKKQRGGAIVSIESAPTRDLPASGRG